MSTPLRAAGVTGLAVAAAVVLAGCTPGTAPGGPATSAASSAATSLATSSASSAAPTSPAVASPSAPATASGSPSSSPAQVTVQSRSGEAPRSTCRSVAVRVIRGSADRGREFAALQFTNTGTTRCTLNGYPVVTLLLRGRAVGTASQPAGPATSSYPLAPGATAESRLDDYTTCSAPLSDEIHVVVPGSTQSATRPGQLRACTLRTGALGRPE